MNWFKKQSPLVQILLLIIPVVNWIVEIYVRWSTWLKKGGTARLVICLVVTIFGIFIGWLDAIWCFLFKRLFMQ